MGPLAAVASRATRVVTPTIQGTSRSEISSPTVLDRSELARPGRSVCVAPAMSTAGSINLVDILQGTECGTRSRVSSARLGQ